jgi:NADPH:quinone reductase-like Zn-dependent oxidoreductase
LRSTIGLPPSRAFDIACRFVLAVTVHEFGGPQALRVAAREDPSPPPGWVLVELRAAALNWHDVLLRRGQYDVPLPRIIGADGAGVRRDGGEEVLVLPSLYWGGAERAPGPDFEILGDFTDGTYAELVAIPAENAVPKPARFDWREAAALPLASLTAYRALFSRGGLQTGETVLVVGAGGGVAGIAIGLARIAGARVLVTTSSERKLELARSLGAEGGALYTDPEWPAQVRELTAGAGVDLVVDSAGSGWEGAFAALARGGRLVTFGATAAARAEIDIRRLYFAQQSILGTTMGSPRDFAGLLRLLEQAPDWRPPIGAAFPLAEVAEAHALMERREHTGKIVLDIGR